MSAQEALSTSSYLAREVLKALSNSSLRRMATDVAWLWSLGFSGFNFCFGGFTLEEDLSRSLQAK